MAINDLPNLLSPFIKIQFKHVSLTASHIGGQGARPDYFTSLTHKRFVDKANTCEISISYVPSGESSVNAIEAAIVDSAGVCEFSYGYVGKKSYTYKALVYDYSVSFNNGYLDYNFKLISQAITTNSETVVDYSFGSEEEENSKGMDGGTFLFLLEDEIKSKGYFDGTDYQFSIGYSDKGFRLPVGGIHGGNLTPIGALKDMAKAFIPNDGSDTKYKVVVDDSIGKSTSHKIFFKKSGTYSIDYDFDWNAKDGEVISWNPSFQGAKAIFFARGSADSDTGPVIKQTTIGTDGENGVFETLNTSGIVEDNSVRFLSDTRTNLRKSLVDLTWFYDAAKYSYKATIEVIGTPEVSLVSTYVNVRPRINGMLHHSAGTYMVIGITDKVSSNGFTTQLELVKMDNIDEIYKMGEQVLGLVDENESKAETVVHKPGHSGRVVTSSGLTNGLTMEVQ